MAGNGLFQEIPYGYAWFLRLAREGAAAHPELLAMGDVAAARLQADTDQLSPLGMELGVTADDYQNVSWVLTNVADWARFREDDTLLQWAEETVRDRVLPLEDVCPLEDDLGPADQFFPPCLLRARAIVRILPLGEAAAWADSALPAEFPIEPLSTATSAHSAGLTWSRAWGLWDLWAFTGDPRWRDAYRAHVLAWYELPQFWAEDYQAYAHWVAQFGVHAIDLSYEGE
jgi:hypothetical protein